MEVQHFSQIKARQIITVDNKKWFLPGPLPVGQQGARTAQQNWLMIEDCFQLFMPGRPLFDKILTRENNPKPMNSLTN
ncbi:hypothetical protein ACFL0B_05955, partial [Thermodesulfobacteriota bacterium]